MIGRFAVPFLILAVFFLPLPFVIASLLFGALLAVRPRGEPRYGRVAIRRSAGPGLLRSPPR
jgi:hypothetical protein